MKSITVRLTDEEYERLRERAYVAREKVGPCAAMVLSAAINNLGREDLKQKRADEKKQSIKPEMNQSVINAPQQKGIDIALAVPVNTAEEASAKVAELAARKKAEELKRLTEAGKALEKRYGKG